jgi:hypothetical protein
MILKWWRGLATQEKWMVALIAMLLVGVAVRWAWVSDEVAGAWRDRFTEPTEQTDSLLSR